MSQKEKSLYISFFSVPTTLYTQPMRLNTGEVLSTAVSSVENLLFRYSSISAVDEKL